MHEHFVQEIDEVVLPKLAGFEKEALQNLEEANKLYAQGISRAVTRANAAASKTAVEACRAFAATLNEHKAAILAENARTKEMIAVATNTYQTMRLSDDLTMLMGEHRRAFAALKDIPLPPLRPFKNAKLQQEVLKLNDRLLADG